MTSIKLRRRKFAKQKTETPAPDRVSFVIDGQHEGVTNELKNEYSALAPAGKNILKSNLQQLQMFSRDPISDPIKEPLTAVKKPKAKSKLEMHKDDPIQRGLGSADLHPKDVKIRPTKKFKRKVKVEPGEQFEPVKPRSPKKPIMHMASEVKPLPARDHDFLDKYLPPTI